MLQRSPYYDLLAKPLSRVRSTTDTLTTQPLMTHLNNLLQVTSCVRLRDPHCDFPTVIAPLPQVRKQTLYKDLGHLFQT